MNRPLADTVRTPSLRARLARRGIALLPAALAALGVAQPTDAAQVSSSWTGASSGNWIDPTKWSGGVPNNAGSNTFAATIGAPGPAYAVTLGTNIALDSLALNSPDATLSQTGGTLAVLNAMSISAGTYMLNGGTFSGGTINLSGSGTLAFGNASGRLDGTVVNGGLSLANFNGSARLLDGARFTGNAAVSAGASILNYEYDATLGSGQTITLGNDTATVGVARNSTTNTDSTLTIAPGAAVRGRGRITSGIFTSGSNNRLVNDGTIAADISGGTFTVDPNIFVNNGALTSAGGATLSVNGGSFTNHGSVNANGGTVSITATNWTNAAGRTMAATDGTLKTGGTWFNAGTISINNSTLNLGGTFTTAGMNLANFSRTGGTVNLTGALDNTGVTLPLTAATGSWRLVGGTIKGGTITRAGGADLVFTNSAGVLDGTTIIGDLNIAESSGYARLQDGADFTGNATLSGFGGILNYEYNATIGAGRTINLDGSVPSLSVASSDASTDSTLTIAAGAAVRGNGNITSGNFTGGTTNRVVNNGAISADLAAKTLTINPNIFINNGHARASNGSTLTVSSTNWSNAAGGSISIDGSTANFSNNWSSPGALNLSNGATLNMGGTFSTGGLNLGAISRAGATTINLTGNLNNTGSTLALTGTTDSWRLLGGTINGGTLTRAGGADLVFTNSGGALSSTTVPGDITFTESSSRVSMRNGGDFTGNATLNAFGSLLNYEYDATIGAGRTVNLDGAASTLGIAQNSAATTDSTLTIAPGATVRGRGEIASGHLTGGTANRVINNGNISGDIAGATLTVRPNLFTNNAAMHGTNGSTLTISAGSWSNAAAGSITLENSTGNFSGNWSNAGSVILNNATLNMGGTMTTGGLALDKFSRSGATTVNLTGTLDNNAATLALGNSSGAIRLNGGTINGGTIVRSGSGELVFTSTAVALSGTNIIGDIAVTEHSARARMQNGADFTGNATLSSTASMLNYEYDATIGSGRTINLEGPGAMLSVARNGAASTDSTLTIAPGATVRGKGSILSSQFTGGSTNHVINNGLIHADTNAGLGITPNRFTNNGTVQASNGGSVSMSNTVFTNAAGRLRAESGGKIRAFSMSGNLNDSVADGSGSLIDLDGASYTINQLVSVTNGATLNLRGGWQKSGDMNVGGRVVFDYPDPDPESTTPFDTIRTQIATGYNNGAWNGPGINSAQAAADPGFGVGYAESHTIFPSGNGGQFGGVTVDDHAVLVAYTRYGDTDLNGAVTLADFNRVAANFGRSGAFWTDGDFNYDGIVGLIDFNRLAGNFGLSASEGGPSPEDWAALGAAVPEPTGPLGAILMGGLGILRRRQRRSLSSAC